MSDPRTEKARLADDLEALRLMVSQAPKPICDIAGDTLARAIAAVEAHMPDGEQETFEMWAVQYYGKRVGWWTSLKSIRRTRSEAISAWKMLWTEGELRWRSKRKAGRIRCVRVIVTAPTGDET